MRLKMTSLPLLGFVIFLGAAYASQTTGNVEPYANIDSLKALTESIRSMFQQFESSNVNFRKDFLRNPYIEPMMKIIQKKLSIYEEPVTKKFKLINDEISHVPNNIGDSFESLMKIGRMMKNHDDIEAPEIVNMLESLNTSSLCEHIQQNSEHSAGSAKKAHVEFKQQEIPPPPAQYILFKRYTNLVSCHLKSLTLDIFRYYYNYANNENIISEKLHNQIALRLNSTEDSLEKEHSLISKSLFGASRKIEFLEPKSLIQNETFIELERVFQLTAYPERLAHPDLPCNTECSSLQPHVPQGNQCQDDFCIPCEGRVKNCEGDASLISCDPSDPASTRRHEWIETYGWSIHHPFERKKYDSSRRYGTVRNSTDLLSDNQCSEKSRTAKVSRFMFLCKFCVCTCEENMHFSKKSTFIISSKLVNADVLNNRVIIGVRFKKVDRIIYTQIRQAKLFPGGWIDQSTNEWKQLEILDRTLVNKQIEANYKSSVTDNSYKDFIVISEHVKNVNLDDVKCPYDDYVVTGVSLGMSKIEGNENRITLRINCHLVDFEHGKIMPHINTTLLESSRPHKERQKFGLMPPDRVGKGNYEKTPTFSNYRYAEISMSDKERDAGQSVVPWFDAQSITSETSVPLNGVGIYHRGSSESGGFFAYRLFSVDYSQFI